jgi:hypothetical protein
VEYPACDDEDSKEDDLEEETDDDEVLAEGHGFDVSH